MTGQSSQEGSKDEAGIGGLYESEAHRLQREADNYTKDLEHERKHFMIISDNIKNQNETIGQLKETIKEKIPNPELEHREYVRR